MPMPMCLKLNLSHLLCVVDVISMDDFLGKQTEFKMWLHEEVCPYFVKSAMNRNTATAYHLCVLFPAKDIC